MNGHDVSSRQERRLWGRAGVEAQKALIITSVRRLPQQRDGVGYSASDTYQFLTNKVIAKMAHEHAVEQTLEDLNSARQSYEAAAAAVLVERERYVELQLATTKDLEGALSRLRDLRMAIASEARTITSDLQGICELLNSEQSIKARVSATQLCDLAERLTAIQKSGALEAIVSVALRMGG